MSRPSPRRAIWDSTSIKPHASVPRRTAARCWSPESTRESLSDSDLAGIDLKDLGEHHAQGSLASAHLPARRRRPSLGVSAVAQRRRASSRVPSRAARTSSRRRRATTAASGALGSPRDLEDRRLISRSSAGRSGRFYPRRDRTTRDRWQSSAGALFASGRSVVEADRYLASLDRDSMERRLREYREMGVVSRRARGEAEALASRIAHIDRLAARRNGVEETASELAAGDPLARRAPPGRTDEPSPRPEQRGGDPARARPVSEPRRRRRRRRGASSVSWT